MMTQMTGRPPARRTFARFFAPAAGLAATYVLAVRPWMLRWGATDDELSELLPGDEVVTTPRSMDTRAVTIDAPAACVWPWLVQFGQGRGGLYSYDWLENLAGCDIHSTDAILPEHQRLAVGNLIRLVRPDYPVPLVFTVAQVDPERALVLRANGEAQQVIEAGLAYCSWAFVLRPTSAHQTRLIARWRADFAQTPSSLFWNKYGIEPIHFVMERKMLLGIKARAEKMAASSPSV